MDDPTDTPDDAALVEAMATAFVDRLAENPPDQGFAWPPKWHELSSQTQTEISQAMTAALAAIRAAGWHVAQWRPIETALAGIRAAGWNVAVHNDYRQDGIPHTFWLFTRDGRCVKGEGLSDREALDRVYEQIAPQPPETTP